MSKKVTAYLGMGSNVGDREANLLQALELLKEKVRIEKLSSPYETEPVGYKEQPWFLNLVCSISTSFSPLELLSFVKSMETSMGRVPAFPNAPRLIDVDILLYGDEMMESAGLIIPHPRLAQRSFVLIPLLEIAPDVVCPRRGKTIRELVAALIDHTEVKKVEWHKGEPLRILQLGGGS